MILVRTSPRISLAKPVYWAVLLGVVAWRPVLDYWRLQRTDALGQVSLSFDGSFLSLVLWFAGPPLLLFVAWLILRSRKRAAHSDARPTA